MKKELYLNSLTVYLSKTKNKVNIFEFKNIMQLNSYIH